MTIRRVNVNLVYAKNAPYIPDPSQMVHNVKIPHYRFSLHKTLFSDLESSRSLCHWKSLQVWNFWVRRVEDMLDEHTITGILIPTMMSHGKKEFVVADSTKNSFGNSSNLAIIAVPSNTKIATEILTHEINCILGKDGQDNI